jgi:L-iditol 2-dehydrogenase
LVSIPDGVTDEEAAIMEPVALALRTINVLKPDVNDFATVIGQGPVGLLTTQAAKLAGCRVIAVDIEDQKLKLAEKFGADFCINAANDDVIKRVLEITKRGSDVVVEAAGTSKAVEQTPFIVRKAGRVALIGSFSGALDLEQAYEANFFSMHIAPAEYPVAVELVSQGKIDVKSLITHRFRLGEIEKAFRIADTPDEKPIKIVITT